MRRTNPPAAPPAAAPAAPPAAPPVRRPARAPRRSQAERSQAMRERLIAATIEVVRERSYHGTTVFEVAKAAGVTPGALQHHFDSKAALMLEALAQILRSSGAEGVPWPDPALPLAERAERYVQGLWRRVYEPPRFLAAWSLYFGAAGDPALRGPVAAQRATLAATLRARFASVFPEAAAAGNAAAFSDLVLSALRGMAVARLFDPAPRQSAAQLRTLAEIIVAHCQAARPKVPRRSRSQPV